MAASLDIHPASTSERRQLYTNTYEFWGAPGATLEQHIAERMNSPQHNRGRWYAGCLDGRPVCGLGAYPMEFQIAGQVVPGIAIGSVHTVPRCRRRGYAATLLQWVEDRERSNGAALSVLYSNIAPEYYAKFGYALCGSYCGWLEAADFARFASRHPESERLEYVVCNPHDRRSEIESLYSTYHSAWPLFIHRSASYWDYVFRKGANDEFALLTDRKGRVRGYSQLALGDGNVHVMDWATADKTAETERSFYLALVKEAERRGWKSIGGWLPNSEVVRSLFPVVPRTTELTMVKALDPALAISDEMLLEAQHFREIDHV